VSQLCFKLNRIDDCVGQVLIIANQGWGTATLDLMHFHPRSKIFTSIHFLCSSTTIIRPVYTTSVLGTAPLKMGTVPKLPLRYLLVYTTTFCRHTLMIGTVPIGKRHLYFPFTTVYFRINMSDRNRIIYLYLLERRRVLYEPKIEGKTQLNTRKVL
jgi:hypothetical protein